MISICVIGCLYLLYTFINEMENYAEDNLKSVNYSNNMLKYNEFKMKDINYMVMVEIRSLSTIDSKETDILNDLNPNALQEHDFDLEKLKEYFTIFTTIRRR